MPKVSFSNEHNEFDNVALYYNDTSNAIREYYANHNTEKFILKTPKEIEDEKKDRMDELEISTIFTLLSAIEARLRIDYLHRVYDKDKSVLSRKFRDIYKKKENTVSLVDDILKTWRAENFKIKTVLDTYGEAIRYRDWIAHGRYWLPRVKFYKYDFFSIYTLSKEIESIVDYSQQKNLPK